VVTTKTGANLFCWSARDNARNLRSSGMLRCEDR